jgi:hypothetical protein
MIEHLAASCIIAPDVEFDVDVVLGVIDALGQGWEKLIAIN